MTSLSVNDREFYVCCILNKDMNSSPQYPVEFDWYDSLSFAFYGNNMSYN